MNRIEQIKSARIRIEKNKAAQQSDYENKISLFELEVIEKYSKRIFDLLNTARGLITYGFQLGNADWSGDNLEFESNGITHRFGFVLKGTTNTKWPRSNVIELLGIGWEGGGCCGHNNLVLTENGIADFNDWFFKTRVLEGNFQKDFDDFEKRFYHYVDSL